MIEKILEIKKQIAALKTEQQKLERQFLSQQDLSGLQNKEYGCGTITLDCDNHKVKIEVRKTVKWDNDALAAKYKELGQEAGNFIKCKYDISETAYKGWKEEIKKYFEDARTVVPSNPTLTIIDEEE